MSVGPSKRSARPQQPAVSRSLWSVRGALGDICKGSLKGFAHGREVRSGEGGVIRKSVRTCSLGARIRTRVHRPASDSWPWSCDGGMGRSRHGRARPGLACVVAASGIPCSWLQVIGGVALGLRPPKASAAKVLVFDVEGSLLASRWLSRVGAVCVPMRRFVSLGLVGGRGGGGCLTAQACGARRALRAQAAGGPCAHSAWEVVHERANNMHAHVARSAQPRKTDVRGAGRLSSSSD